MPPYHHTIVFARSLLRQAARKRALQGMCLWPLLLLKASCPGGADLGFLYDEFELTLHEGRRIEILGPLFSWEQRESSCQWAVHPFFSIQQTPEVERCEWDALYPALTYNRTGKEYRLQFFQWLSLSGGQDQAERQTRRVTLFPLFFYQDSEIPEEDYVALFPLHGRLQRRFFRDEIEFTLFPLYSRTRKRDVVTRNYLYPVFHWRTGDNLRGWQVWPLLGHEHKGLTYRTNLFDEVQPVGGHEKWFALWPLFFHSETGLGTDNPVREHALLPLYSVYRSPQRDLTALLWPIGFTFTADRAQGYRQWGLPWPFVVWARGEGRHTDRLWPLFGSTTTSNRQSSFYLWPVYRRNRLAAPPMERERTRILFFLYSDIIERDLDSEAHRRRQDLWPLFTRSRDLEGRERWQVLSLLEPLLPGNRGIERNYSPLWSLCRVEHNPARGTSSTSVLWNLYRAEKTPADKKVAFLFGLIQYRKDSHGGHWRWLHGLGRRPPDHPGAEATRPAPNADARLVETAAPSPTD